MINQLNLKIFRLPKRNTDSLLQVGIYTAANFLTKAISFAVLPFFVHVFSESDMGILSIFSNSLVFLSPILSAGILYTVSADYFKYPKEEFSRRFSTIIYLPVFFTLLSAVFLYSFFGTFQKNYQFDRSFIWLVPLCTFFSICFELFLLLARNENKAKLFGFACIAKTVVELGVAVLLILFVAKNWTARAGGIFVSGLLGFGLFVYFIANRRYFTWMFNGAYIKEELRFSLPAILFQTAIFCLVSSDKFFVMRFYQASQTGIYSIASVFASVLFLFCLAFLQFLQPKFYQLFAQGKGWTEVRYLYRRYNYAMLVFATLLLVGTPMAYRLFLKPSYLPGLKYFYILIVSNFIWSVSNVYLSYIMFKKDSAGMTLFAVFSIVCSLTFYYTGIRYWGLVGLCIASLIVNVLVLAFILYENRRQRFFAL